MVQTTHVLSYLNEATYGSNTINAATATYLFGDIPEPNQLNLPFPAVAFNPISNRDDRDASTIESGSFDLKSEIKFYLMNGIPLLYAMGQAANTTPSYEQHVLTGVWAAGSDKFDLPSFTIHHEADNGSARVKEYYGCKVNKCQLSGIMDSYIECNYAFNAQSTTITGLNELTTPPVLPTTAGTKPFEFKSGTFTWNVTGYSTIVGFTFSVNNILTPIYVHRASNEELPKYIYEGRRNYTFSLSVVINEDVFFTDLLSQTARTFTLLLNRGTNDEISIVLSNSKVGQVGDIFRTKGGNFLYNVFGVAKSATVTVKDEIGSAHYPTQS